MSEEYPDDFLRWARPNPWMQENLAEAYWLWKRRHKGGLPQDKQQKKTAQPAKKKKKNKKKRKVSTYKRRLTLST
jgi:hypothetical protein